TGARRLFYRPPSSGFFRPFLNRLTATLGIVHAASVPPCFFSTSPSPGLFISGVLALTEWQKCQIPRHLGVQQGTGCRKAKGAARLRVQQGTGWVFPSELDLP